MSAAAVGAGLGAAATAADAASNGGAPAFAPGQVVVGYRSPAGSNVEATAARAVGARPGMKPDTRTRVLHVPVGQVHATIARLRKQAGVAYAAPNPIAHVDGSTGGATPSAAPSDTTTQATPETPIVPAEPPAPPPLAAMPDDPGIRGFPGGLAGLQWNFFGPWGVNALQAWANVNAVGATGGKGVRIAVLDTGIAWHDFGTFKKSPDFGNTKFVAPYDFVDHTRRVVDRNGHGTHVAGTIAEATNNRIGVSGLAYGATIMPIRVLDSNGYGNAAAIAKGIRYAAEHNAKVINMSLEFATSVKSSDIPDIISAIRYANARGATVIGSTGNEGEARLAYPARTTAVIAVGATTDTGCLASFSNDGFNLDIVAPGGGDNQALPQDPNCTANHGRYIYQETYTSSVGKFGLPSGYRGTSMAAPHVSATAALLIASRVLGSSPTPSQVECRLKATARPLGLPGPNRTYGWGLVDAGAATSPTVQTPTCMGAAARASPR
ncbi:MAG TPA: S8 family serine peptidase [Conexibacter sp.]